MESTVASVEKPVFNEGELLSIWEAISRVDPKNPGLVSVEDVLSIKKKVLLWFEASVPGHTLR